MHARLVYLILHYSYSALRNKDNPYLESYCSKVIELEHWFATCQRLALRLSVDKLSVDKCLIWVIHERVNDDWIWKCQIPLL